MNMLVRAIRSSWPRLGEQILVPVLSLALLLPAWPQNLAAYQGVQPPPPQPGQAPPPHMQQSPGQLQELVAPIALYPDSLVAQILAASTFPEEVVEADRWIEAHPDLKGQALGQAVDQQPWDPSVKALTAFPAVLGNMDKNLSWVSSLGDAYYNQQQDVMNAVQAMRQRAQAAGNLRTTPQQTVDMQGPTVVIQPASTNVVYVPAYDPWTVYGDPIMAWPGWYPYPGIWFGGPYLSFGLGFGVGWFGGFGWGWGNWGFNWGGGYAMFNNNRYFSRSNTFYNRGNYYRGGGAQGVARNVQRGVNGNAGGYAGRAGVYNRPGATDRPFGGDTRAARGYASSSGQKGVRSSALSGYNHGGQEKSYSSRGSASVGSGGGARSGGGESRGGGGGGGGRGGGGHR
jgi:uncharacterized membrane protein YgcG